MLEFNPIFPEAEPEYCIELEINALNRVKAISDVQLLLLRN